MIFLTNSKGGGLMSSIFYEMSSYEVLNLSEQPLVKVFL